MSDVGSAFYKRYMYCTCGQFLKGHVCPTACMRNACFILQRPFLMYAAASRLWPPCSLFREIPERLLHLAAESAARQWQSDNSASGLYLPPLVFSRACRHDKPKRCRKQCTGACRLLYKLLQYVWQDHLAHRICHDQLLPWSHHEVCHCMKQDVA